jgi:hypothetical protein
MKQLATRSYLFLLFILLTSCNDKNADDTPKPGNHMVAVRITGDGLTGLGAQISGSSTDSQGKKAANKFSLQPTTATISQTQEVGQVNTDRAFSTTISFTNVRGTAQAPYGSYLRADILVNGHTLRSFLINYNTTTSTSTNYVTSTLPIELQDW